MSSIRFARPCTSCHRMLEIGVEMIGRDFHCHHCGSEFVASLPLNSPEADRILDERIDRLLEAADRQMARTQLAFETQSAPAIIPQTINTVGDYWEG